MITTCCRPISQASAAYTGSGGKFLVKYTPTLKGAYSVAVSVDGTAIKGSPFTTAVKSGLAKGPSSTTTILG